VSALMGLVILTFDRLTLKLVRESHLRWATFLPNLGTLKVLELFVMLLTHCFFFYNFLMAFVRLSLNSSLSLSLCTRRTDRQTGRQTGRRNAETVLEK